MVAMMGRQDEPGRLFCEFRLEAAFQAITAA
jgi:hypothetical protein